MKLQLIFIKEGCWDTLANMDMLNGGDKLCWL